MELVSLILLSSLFKLFLSPLHLSTMIFMFCWDIGIFSFLKKIVVNLDSVSLLSGYVGIQTKSSFFSNKDLSFDLVSKIPALIIIFILFRFLSIKSLTNSIKPKFYKTNNNYLNRKNITKDIPVVYINFLSILGFSGDPGSSPSIFIVLFLSTSIGKIAKKTIHQMIM